MKELSLNSCRLDRRYDIRRSLGRGSYAEVFLARDLLASPQSPHSEVVIKALNVYLQDDLDADLERTLIENFQNEALALDRVRHPNVISRLGHGTARDLEGRVFHFLVLEYLSGGDLQAFIRNGKLSFETAFRFVEQVCAGLSHAHSKAVIHRDVKPQNILLTGDLKTVKIADFGVARVSTADAPITRVGTNIYAPPEHSPLSAGRTGALGNIKLTPSADVYSLAKTVYTLLCGEAPRAYANGQIDGLPDRLHNEPWSAEVLRVIKKATRDRPIDRHQTIDEFWADMLRVRALATDAEPETVARSAELPAQPHVTRGYTPIAPSRPSFEVMADRPSTLAANRSFTRPLFVQDAAGPVMHIGGGERAPAFSELNAGKVRSRPRRLAVFALLIAVFAGVLYGTASYMRGRGLLPEIAGLSAERTGIANTDIHLRSEPSTENEPIGLVTKNSRVRIVKSQNNWYQVDVVEQGRQKASPLVARRGWLNGQYLTLGGN
ncbi:MAG: serine/threonine protein kinase [Pyrinomonadaceae bacterium]